MAEFLLGVLVSLPIGFRIGYSYYRRRRHVHGSAIQVQCMGCSWKTVVPFTGNEGGDSEITARMEAHAILQRHLDSEHGGGTTGDGDRVLPWW